MKRKRVPYHIIVKAKAGDSEALAYILKHFEPLILSHCKETGTDALGRPYETINEDLKADIEAHLMTQIVLNYDITRQPPAEDEE